jgi:hypothetical protein
MPKIFLAPTYILYKEKRLDKGLIKYDPATSSHYQPSYGTTTYVWYSALT